MSCKILIVEDDPELQELYAAMLEAVDCQLIQVFDGKDAWQELQDTVPDLLILDIILDEIMGDTLFAAIKDDPRYRAIPTIIVSVLSPGQCQHLLEMSPETTFLRKPFRKEQLLEAIIRNLGANGKKETSF